MTRLRRTGAGTVVRFAALIAAGGLLAGCLSVPHSGRVVVGNNGTSSVRNVPLEARVLAAPPAPGESPTQIVHDFYNAMVDYNNKFAVAKQYLAKGALKSWTNAPAHTVVVLDVGQPDLVSRTDSAATFAMHFVKVGEVLADHEFVAASGQQSTDIFSDSLSVVRDPDNGNEWRIASGAPTALRLSIADFKAVYHEATLYFPRKGKDLPPVADRRWFAARRAELPRAIADAYVDGPSAFLAADKSISPIFPAGAVALDATPTALGDAAVAFGVAPASMTDGLQAALVTSLQLTFQRESSDFSSVVVTLNGVQSTQQLATGSVDPGAPATVQSAWFIDGKQVLRPWADAGTPTGVGDFPPQFNLKDLQSKDLQSVSLSPDMLFAASDLVQADKTHALRIVARDLAGQDVLLHASSLSSFTWSADSRVLWVAGAVAGVPTLWYITINLVGDGRAGTYFVGTQVVAVDSELTRDGRTLLDVRPAPDDVHISAIVLDPATKLRVLYVGRIDTTQSTPSVLSFRRIAPVLTPPVRVKGKPLALPSFTVARALWTDAETLVVVASTGGGLYQVLDATVDGSQFTALNAAGGPTFGLATGFAVAKNAHMLALAPAVDPKKRQLYELTDAGWVQVRPRGDGAAVLAVMYPG